MKTRIRFVYNKHKRLNKNREAPIYIEVAFNADKRKFINTKIYIEPQYWNSKKNEVTSKHPAYINTNLYLQEFINKITKYEIELINSGKQLTPELLDNFIKGNSKNDQYFFEFVNEKFNAESLGLGTYKKDRSVINKLEKHSPTLLMSGVNYDYVINVDNWLKQQKGINSLNTVGNYHKVLKKYINLAINLGLMKYEQNPYNQFKVKKSPTTKVNLTETELNKLETCIITNPYIEKIQQMFLFSCYTGLRFSDIVNLQKKHYDIKDDEISIIIGKMVKTQKPVELPLNMLFNGKAVPIFKKFYNENETYLFGEPLTNQHINRELKFISKVAGIHKEITFHMARHTFGSLLAEKTGDPYLIKDLMGHSDIKMSMEYIHGSRKGRNDKLMKVEW